MMKPKFNTLFLKWYRPIRIVLWWVVASWPVEIIGRYLGNLGGDIIAILWLLSLPYALFTIAVRPAHQGDIMNYPNDWPATDLDFEALHDAMADDAHACWIYPKLSAEGCYRAEACGSCHVRRDEHADQNLQHALSSQDITDHAFTTKAPISAAQTAIDRMIQAIKDFGEYTFHDKGPDDVMDLDRVVKDFAALPVQQCADELAAVFAHSEHGETLHSALMTALFEDGEHPDADALGELVTVQFPTQREVK